MTDYQMQFTGQIESKRWLGFPPFRHEELLRHEDRTLRPGAMAITHFAVVDGRRALIRSGR